MLTTTHSLDKWTLLARANFYGPYENFNSDETQEFDTEVLFDFEGSYAVSDDASVHVGVRNAFDNYPDPDVIGDACCGRIYRSDSIVDWLGGYYYAKVTTRF